MALSPQIINARPSLQRPLPKKEIFWPTTPGRGNRLNADSTRFPPFEAIKTRFGMERPEPLAEFAKAVSEAQDNVLIIDDYLLKPKDGSTRDRVSDILEWFPLSFAAKDVRLLTREVGTPEVRSDIVKTFAERSASINNRAYNNGIQIQIKFTLEQLFPYVHDRYAIIDGELWHFGATVGGFHHQVNAATRGWSAEEHQAYEFFDLAWQGDGDRGRSHDKKRSR